MITFNWLYSNGTTIGDEYKYFFINKLGKGFVSANKPILSPPINDSNWWTAQYSTVKTYFVGNYSNVDWELSMQERPINVYYGIAIPTQSHASMVSEVKEDMKNAEEIKSTSVYKFDWFDHNFDNSDLDDADVSQCYKWFAVNQSGKGFVYVTKPELHSNKNCWNSDENNRGYPVGNFSNYNWQLTLQERLEEVQVKSDYVFDFDWELAIKEYELNNSYEWFAITRSGKGYVFATKPELVSSGFIERYDIEDLCPIPVGEFPNKNWQQSLQQKPEPKTSTTKTYTVDELEAFVKCNSIYKYLISDLNDYEIKKEEDIQDMVKTLINKGYKVTKD